MPPAVEFVELGTDGEEIEYAEFTSEELLQQVAELKAQLAGLVDEASIEIVEDTVSTE